jgi:hypothetical protein
MAARNHAAKLRDDGAASDGEGDGDPARRRRLTTARRAGDVDQ